MPKNTTVGLEERYGFRRNATEVRAQVPISRYIEDTGITQLRRAGLRLQGLCMFHEEKTASFTVYGDSTFYCFGCGTTGDVIDLHAYVNGHEDLWTAMLDLAERYGVDLSQRPDKWYRRQDDKAKVRAATKRHVASVYQRRLTRIYAPLVLVGGEEPDEELEELQELAAALWPTCLDMAERRVAGE